MASITVCIAHSECQGFGSIGGGGMSSLWTLAGCMPPEFCSPKCEKAQYQHLSAICSSGCYLNRAVTFTQRWIVIPLLTCQKCCPMKYLPSHLFPLHRFPGRSQRETESGESEKFLFDLLVLCNSDPCLLQHLSRDLLHSASPETFFTWGCMKLLHVVTSL